MKINICIINPPGRKSVGTFIELAELLFYSIKELSKNVLFNINNIDSSSRNIILGGNLLPIEYLKNLPKDSILINTEQYSYSKSSWIHDLVELSNIFEIWDYSEINIKKFKEKGVCNIKHLKIGFQKELIRIPDNLNQNIDVLFYGAINERRKIIFQSLEREKLNIKVLSGVYGTARDKWISDSKIILNMHYYDSQIFEIIRIFYLCINSKAVISEVNEDTSISDIYNNLVYKKNYDNLIDGCKELVNNLAMRNQLKKTAFEELSKYPQKIFTNELLA